MKIKLEKDFAVEFSIHVIIMCSSEGIKLATVAVFPQADVGGLKMAAYRHVKKKERNSRRQK